MSIVLGPVLRHAGETTASVWVQLDQAATVSVLGCDAPTFEVCGHHYAIVPVTGLEPDTWASPGDGPGGRRCAGGSAR
jgi:hypothetical protein